ncbi:MAG: heavy-metal-associated domain-containing protein [Synergistetes bacterium]|nr:heavy-metal-associated domain-containing protein [Synergistota bacterium]MDW8191690.1 heavy-metal-associated domain-containing protein [Synergistota bacterium]
MKYILKVPNISCDHCKKRIAKALEELGLKDFNISVEEKKIELNTENIEPILKKLSDIGYPASYSFKCG